MLQVMLDAVHMLQVMLGAVHMLQVMLEAVHMLQVMLGAVHMLQVMLFYASRLMHSLPLDSCILCLSYASSFVPSAQCETDERLELARRAAREGIVLLKVRSG
jgi:hypothetical protein